MAEKKDVKRGDLVKVIQAKLEDSLEAKASDTRFPPYIYKTEGEV
ncbi:MAG: NAD(P)H-quinone oxidoreductase subunit O, partial [Cyanobacteria bacterium P01_H01_bin.119]